MSEDAEEQRRVEIAKALRAMYDRMPAEVDLIYLQAARTFIRYQALLKAGFNEQQAMSLCHKSLEI